MSWKAWKSLKGDGAGVFVPAGMGYLKCKA